jgi:hypothetical protein
VRFRDVEQPSNLKAFAGRLRDARTNTSVDFSVVVGEGSGDVPIVPGAGASSWGGGGAAHHPSGPPVTPEALRRQLERSGLWPRSRHATPRRTRS